MYLLDANVISELRKADTSRIDLRVQAWAAATDSMQYYLSSVIVMELETGVQRLERRDPRQGAVLRAWLDNRVLRAFAGRILPLDTVAALHCASLHVPNPRAYRDSMIAAVAAVHDLTVVTRNVKDFRGTGVKLLNPWET